MKIIHISDTHISHRKFINVRDSWKIPNRVTWIEEDYCLGFKQALDIAADSKCEYVIHAGDLFDVPVGRNLAGPTEYSRTFVLKTLKEFFEKTNYSVPFIVIDGNHGTYLTRNYSTIEFIQAAFPKTVFIATNFHLKKAILEDQPLTFEFDDVIFYLFPYFKFGKALNITRQYEEWVRKNQQPDPSKLSIAVAHGMAKNLDLHDLVLTYPYDYVALGHDHKQKKISDKAWQAGSTVKYTFAERNNTNGILEVQIIKGEKPVVLPKLIESKRELYQYEITLNSDTFPSVLEQKIDEKIKQFKGKFNGEKASRIKFALEGVVRLTNWWEMEDIFQEKQKEVFSEDYNIIEFRWETQDLEKSVPMSYEKGAKIYDYLVENPAKDFERYIRSLGIEDENLAKIIIEQGAAIITEIFSDSSTIKEQEVGKLEEKQ